MKFGMLLLAVFISSQASANILQECFKRTYSAAHLRANPSQIVKTIELDLLSYQDNEVQVVESSLSVETKRMIANRSYFMTTYGCNGTNEETMKNLTCSDSGQTFRVVSRNAQSVTVRVTSPMVLAAIESDTLLTLNPGRSNGIFVLNKVSCN